MFGNVLQLYEGAYIPCTNVVLGSPLLVEIIDAIAHGYMLTICVKPRRLLASMPIWATRAWLRDALRYSWRRYTGAHGKPYSKSTCAHAKVVANRKQKRTEITTNVLFTQKYKPILARVYQFPWAYLPHARGWIDVEHHRRPWWAWTHYCSIHRILDLLHSCICTHLIPTKSLSFLSFTKLKMSCQYTWSKHKWFTFAGKTTKIYDY